jgi:FkbM family methyltransferase
MIQRRPWWKAVLARRLHRWWQRLENNSLADFERNGERAFLTRLLDFYARRGPIRVFDVGAHVGAWSALVLDEAARRGLGVQLHAFEPGALPYSQLKQRFGARTDVTLVQAGVSDAAGEAALHYDAMGSSLASLHVRDGQPSGETVRLRRLEDYLAESRIPRIELIKLDVEGNELAALRGLGGQLDAGRIDFIQFEYGGTYLDAGTSLRDCYRLLDAAGFRIAKIMPGGIEPRCYAPIMENFQYSNYVAYAPRLEKEFA